MFHGIEFEKKGGVFKKAALKKIKSLQAKVKEREQRIIQLKKDWQIDDSVLVEILAKGVNQHTAYYGATGPQGPSGSHGVTGQTGRGLAGKRASGGMEVKGKEPVQIPNGVVQNIVSERHSIDAEKDQIQSLGLLARNINVKKSHGITFEELKFLGF